jgi:DNA-binding CsgD family transcriptional regulator
MDYKSEDILIHYGMPRRSGRYPFGSGDDPYQHGRDLLGRIEELKKSGWTETPENIQKEFGMTTSQYRKEKSMANAERRALLVDRAKSLAADNKGATEIGKIMGVNESTVRSWLDSESEKRMNQAKNTAEFLKKEVDAKKMIDVGTGVERELRISKEKLNEALYILEQEGYPVYKGGIPQVTNPGKQINQKVLCVPGTEHKEIYEYDKVKTIKEYVSHDGGDTFDKFVYPKSLDSKRLKVLLADEVGPDGLRGIDKDGIVELRRGVSDISLGNDHYSQVRIMVDGKKYIKGVAVYSDNLPDGVDVLFNSNKTSIDKALKDIKEDPDNPFGALIKPGGQSYYTDKDGNKQLSLINKTRGEGDWSEWKDALPSQFLGKQSLSLAKKQLNLAKADKLAEYDEICSLTNPTIKKHLLDKFADECDGAAVNLQAAALPGQKYHVIIPINTLGDHEVYAPRYEDGTKLALIRYPHGGTFEIPILTVNNKHASAKKLIGNTSTDAVGINKKIAEQLSGADFDGDTVMCIPTHDSGRKVMIKNRRPLKDLEGFDTRERYSYSDEELASGKAKLMKNTGTQMGIISNLITDMTLGGANEGELARAVKHSMVVIDAEKHKLNYKKSEIDNNIAELKKKYQRYVDEDGNLHVGGASTILSRAKGEASVNKRQGSAIINRKGHPDYDPTRPEGALIYKTADDLYYPIRSYDKKSGIMTISTAEGKKITYDVKNKEEADRYTPVKRVDPKTGEVTYTDRDGTIQYKVDTRKDKSTRMAETDNAYSLVSEAKHPMEMLYADYANSMKSLANRARMEKITTGKIEYSASAKSVYKNEVRSLETKLNTALLNATREREAQRRANAEIAKKKADNPDLKPADLKKASQQALTKYRHEVGSISRRNRNIEITDREWEAIQAGAISENRLSQILNNTDTAKLRQRAMPRATTTLSTAKINTIKAMSASNYTLEQIANKLGVSATTVSKYLKGVK